MGIGRPNIELTFDAAGPATERKATIQMDIVDLTAQEAGDLLSLMETSMTANDRKPVKDKLKKLMSAPSRKNFKSGNKLIDALNDKPKDDEVAE